MLTAQAARAQDIADRFTQLNAATRWTLISETPVAFDTFHPQGMARVGEDLFVSSVEVTNRSRGDGKGHLFRMHVDGRLAGQVELIDGVRYHPGGIDYDGTRIWVPVAEYRPNSSSAVFVVDPADLRAHKLFSFPDHLGAIAHDAQSGTLVGVSWGSRTFYRWRTRQTANGGVEVIDPDKPEIVPNPAHYIDFQDLQWISGSTRILCGGLKGYNEPGGRSIALSGLELFDAMTLAPAYQVPVPLWDSAGRPMLQNPFHAETTERGLRFFFMPADNTSTLFEYEVETVR
jgi:hypothetical protein